MHHHFKTWEMAVLLFMYLACCTGLVLATAKVWKMRHDESFWKPHDNR